MLGDKDVIATLPVKSVEAAKPFYEGTLGLTPSDFADPGGIIYRSGSTNVLVYESEYAGTNEGTAATWAVGGDFDRIVDSLRSKGVTFEQYDLPGTTREGDIHEFGDMKAVWFKDPDGNILNISTGPPGT
jgi:catechol 2,3-dioxygenase-like lactoylglutathione lyase family enzyme